ncbi:MAG TPA: hypothetical protein ENJ54_03940 [Chloroflexi bacterium]|nr:hypothetical protein [Chloroflexota bacterium]
MVKTMLIRSEKVEQTRALIKQRFEDFPTPNKSYVVLMAPRSGSTLLCKSLGDVEFGNPIEAFHKERALRDQYGWDINFDDPYEYLVQVLEYQTRNGILGMKLNWGQFQRFLKIARNFLDGIGAPSLEPHETLEVFFPNLLYIHIKRRDKLAQAISYSKALQTGEWLRPKSGEIRIAHPPQYDRRLIEYSLWKLLAIDNAWLSFLRRYQIPHLEVWYEDLSKKFSETLASVYRYLGVTAEPPPPSLAKQADRTSLAWRERFLQETPWLQEAPMKDYLENGELMEAFIEISIHWAFIIPDRYWESSTLYRYHVLRQQWRQLRARLLSPWRRRRARHEP